MAEKGGVGESVFDGRESRGGGVSPRWSVGWPLGALEEGIEWLDNGGTVWNKSAIKID